MRRLIDANQGVIMKAHFHDRIDYLKVCEIARRIIRDPSLIATASDFVET